MGYHGPLVYAEGWPVIRLLKSVVSLCLKHRNHFSRGFEVWNSATGLLGLTP